MTTIPNVYAALVQLPDKVAMRKEIETRFREMGWYEVVEDLFIPQGQGMGASQAALILTVSTMARGTLITREEMLTFDAILSNATNKWVELHKPVRTAKILTDHLPHRLS